MLHFSDFSQRNKGPSFYNLTFLSPRFFKKASGILQSPPSVCPSVRLSRYLLLNHWTKSNPIWCVCCSHEWGVQRHFYFWPRPLGPLGGPKRSNVIKYHKISITKSISKIFEPNFACFSQVKDTKHIRQDFHLAAWVRPQGRDLGVP